MNFNTFVDCLYYAMSSNPSIPFFLYCCCVGHLLFCHLYPTFAHTLSAFQKLKYNRHSTLPHRNIHVKSRACISFEMATTNLPQFQLLLCCSSAASRSNRRASTSFDGSNIFSGLVRPERLCCPRVETNQGENGKEKSR